MLEADDPYRQGPPCHRQLSRPDVALHRACRTVASPKDRFVRLPARTYERQVCANTGRSPTAQRTHQSDPLLSFEIGPMNGRKARESGLRPKASVARGATVPETSCKCVGSTRGRSPTCPTLNRCRRKGAAWAHLRADDDRHFSLPRAMFSWPSEGLPSKAVPSEKSTADLRSVPRWCNLPTLSSEAER